ncbi:DUF742 domain-containing protein [Saccharopolyspora rhizosphaerae]|uniref:DUF742 domain-containing protein n=1 Tax=Saccharopolyspora rhizosphaerae TaxID=2492662 RepID=A0A3R8QRT4_9PSEU|nr:DUF742 domain-containing protein [Saccharopolyspora rhizosphaerae]RRO18151.1 DUF742 domain-containing protein [Saccharopolyspora rhizosphaerae]
MVEWSAEEPGPLVRPYVHTGGRTDCTGEELDVSALLSAIPGTDGHGLSLSAAAVRELCVEPVSLAEIAAALECPISVTRVLVGELVDQGMLRLAAPRTDRPDVSFMERLRNDVRNL